MEFIYKAKTNTGEPFEGKIDAPSQAAAVDILHEKGFVILSLEEASRDIFSKDLNSIFIRPNNKDVVIFTRQLATLIDADIPLSEGLRTLAKQMEKPALKVIVADISKSVEGGMTLSMAIGRHGKLFSKFYIKLIQSGEVTGKLHESLLYLADYLERSQNINSKIKGALAYPAFVLFSLLIVAAIMMIYVLPQLLGIFEEVGDVDLPITTKILIWLTEFINNYLVIVAIAIFGTVYGIWAYIRTAGGRAWLDNLKINAYSVGPVIRNLYLARIAESLSTLIKSGISILDSLSITADLVGNKNYELVLKEAEANVRNGGTISEIFMKSKDIPPLVSSMVSIGEKTGKLDYMLGHIAKFYKSESDTAIEGISQLIEPILVLVLGFAVAILVSSILLPIYSLVGAS